MKGAYTKNRCLPVRPFGFFWGGGRVVVQTNSYTDLVKYVVKLDLNANIVAASLHT